MTVHPEKGKILNRWHIAGGYGGGYTQFELVRSMPCAKLCDWY